MPPRVPADVQVAAAELAQLCGWVVITRDEYEKLKLAHQQMALSAWHRARDAKQAALYRKLPAHLRRALRATSGQAAPVPSPGPPPP